MCQLRSNFDASLATGRNWPLLVQCLRSLLQDERAKPAAHQAQAQTGKCKSRSITFLKFKFFNENSNRMQMKGFISF